MSFFYQRRNVILSIFLLIISTFIFLIGIFSYYIVEPGFTAIRLRVGSFVDMHKDSGLYFKYPFIDEVIFINNRICIKEIEAENALTSDLQRVGVKFVINYKVEDAMSLYKNIGTDFENILIEPLARESIKSGLSRFTAEHLIQYRDQAKEVIQKDLTSKLKPHNIHLIELSFSNSQFSSLFMDAVEQKQIALQASIAAKNLTEKVKEESDQVRIQADAQAYALQVKKEALTPELLELKKIEKWDGVLPHYSGNLPTIKI